MERRFQSAESNIGASDPRSLRDDGVQVYFAPQIAPGTKVVDLESGRVAWFDEGEDRPEEGYFAEFESLERYFRKHDLPLNEVEGWAVAQTTGRTAGDPLRGPGTSS